MTKNEFLEKLSAKISVLPSDDKQKSIAYYGEMIDDCMENGMSEEKAVLSMGSVDSVAEQILEEASTWHIVKEKVRPKRKLSVFEIVLIVLGSPVWLSLLVAVAAVIASLIMAVAAALISVVATLWAVGAAFVGTSLCGGALAVWAFVHGYAAQGFCFIGAGLLLAGLSILMYFASLYATIGCAKLVKMMALYGKRQLTKGGNRDA